MEKGRHLSNIWGFVHEPVEAGAWSALRPPWRLRRNRTRERRRLVQQHLEYKVQKGLPISQEGQERVPAQNIGASLGQFE